MVERSIAWLVASGHRRVGYRGIERNQLGLSLRVAGLNLRRLINLGLDHNGAWVLASLPPATSSLCRLDDLGLPGRLDRSWRWVSDSPVPGPSSRQIHQPQTTSSGPKISGGRSTQS
jgi:hypothetical protein